MGPPLGAYGGSNNVIANNDDYIAVGYVAIAAQTYRGIRETPGNRSLPFFYWNHMKKSKVGKRKGKGWRKKSPRCTLCTYYRWLGNSKGRKRHSYYRQQQAAQACNSVWLEYFSDTEEVVGSSPTSPTNR